MSEPKQATNVTVEPELRKKKLVRKTLAPAKTRHMLWMAGHGASVVFGLISLVWTALWLPNRYYIYTISYTVAMVGAATALAMSLSHKYGLKYLPPMTALLAQHNFQFLVLALIWCFTFKTVFKTIPFFLVSLLQLADHFKIGAVVEHAQVVGRVVGINELILVVYLALRTLLFRRTAGYQLVTVLVFFWLRVLFDKDAAHLFAFLIQKLDGHVLGIKNEKVTTAWLKVKGFVEDKTKAGSN